MIGLLLHVVELALEPVGVLLVLGHPGGLPVLLGLRPLAELLAQVRGLVRAAPVRALLRLLARVARLLALDRLPADLIGRHLLGLGIAHGPRDPRIRISSPADAVLRPPAAPRGA